MSIFSTVLGFLAKPLLKAVGSAVGSNSGGLINTLFGSLLRKSENAHLSGKENEQNLFNAKQAALQRDFARDERLASQAFNEEQAQKQMDFQEYMSSTQYQRQVADMQAAGVNPAMALGGITGASASGAMATSSPASGASASGSSQLQGLSDLLEFAQLKADIDKTKAETKQIQSNTERTEAETTGIEIANAIADKFGMSEAEAKINNLNAATGELLQRVEYEKAQQALAEAQKILVENQAKGVAFENTYKQWESEFIERFGMSSQLAGQLAGAIAGLGETIANMYLKRWIVKNPLGTITNTVTRGPKGVTTSTTTSGKIPMPTKAGGR